VTEPVRDIPVVDWRDTPEAQEQALQWAQYHRKVILDGPMLDMLVARSGLEVIGRDPNGYPYVLREPAKEA